MKLQDGLQFNNLVEVKLITPNEVIKLYGHNLVTIYGKTVFIDRLADTPSLGNITHIAVGTGMGQDVNDTALATELARNTIDSKTANTSTLTIIGAFDITEAVGNISEIGLFNSSSGAGLIAYVDTSSLSSLPVNKQLGDLLEITWTIQLN